MTFERVTYWAIIVLLLVVVREQRRQADELLTWIFELLPHVKIVPPTGNLFDNTDFQW